jgi:penicillin amidase
MKPFILKSMVACLALSSSLVMANTDKAGSSHVMTNKGLSAPAKVYYNASQIPSVTAETEVDAAFVLGYVHAGDRFYQMDYTRKISQGRLSELVGEAALSNDIEFRTIGFERWAINSMKVLNPQTKAILKAYSDGVNAWLDSNSLPPEYQSLEIDTADRWLPVHSVAIAKVIAFQLSNDLQEIDWTIAINTFQQVGQVAGFDGTALFMEDLYRAAPPDDRVSMPDFFADNGIIGAAGNKSLVEVAADYTLNLNDTQLGLLHNIKANWESTPLIKSMKNDGETDKGSNFWAVSSEHTENGFPLIANDPHLSLDYPSVFYPAHVATEDGLNIAGVQFPGAPITAQGCNESLCWGSTVHPVDETDFYFESIKTNSFGLPTHTVYQGQEEPLVWMFQSYFVNQIGDGTLNNKERANVGYTNGGLTFLVPRRGYGPILDLDTENAQAVSMQFTGFGPTKEVEAFLEMSRAQNTEEFGVALTKFDFGSQNFAVADTDGNVAYYTGAEVPLREDLQTMMQPDGVPPMFIRDGSGEHMNEWMPLGEPDMNQSTPFAVIPFDQMPHQINPERGYIANANNDPVGVSLDNNVLNQVRAGGGLYYISQGGYSAFRQGRLDRIMEAGMAEGKKFNLQDMKELQANNQMMDAELIMPHIMNAVQRASANDAWPGIQQFLADPRVQQAAGYFQNWDFSTPTGLAEGYDPFDNPMALTPPTQAEIDASIAASIYAVWRSNGIRNTIDATLAGIDDAIGMTVLTENRPGNKYSINAFKHLLDAFPENQGYGASGINFFTNPQAPTREDARDYIILASLKQSLDQMAGDDYAAAFGNSTDLTDYRWGKLHRITFSHSLGDQLSVPNGMFGLATVDGLPGVARAGGYQVLDASTHGVRGNSSNGFMFSSGPARRFVGEVTPMGIMAEQVIPGGQSGNITTGANYVNQLFSWLVNDYLPLITDLNTIQAMATEEVEFTP